MYCLFVLVFVCFCICSNVLSILCLLECVLFVFVNSFVRVLICASIGVFINTVFYGICMFGMYFV